MTFEKRSIVSSARTVSVLTFLSRVLGVIRDSVIVKTLGASVFSDIFNMAFEISNLARRVLGEPFSVTEYNHAAPNTYGTEGFLLLAAYAALQDWDAVYVYSYSHRNDAWDEGRISGFFDIAGHAGKMATLLPAAAIRVRIGAGGSTRRGEGRC